jgi:hypothetical protein
MRGFGLMLAVCIADLPGAFCAWMLGAEQHGGGNPPAHDAGLEQESHGKSGIAFLNHKAADFFSIFSEMKKIIKSPCIFLGGMVL